MLDCPETDAREASFGRAPVREAAHIPIAVVGALILALILPAPAAIAQELAPPSPPPGASGLCGSEALPVASANLASTDSERPTAGSFWKSLVTDHWLHLALVLGASELATRLDAAGPRSTPLFFATPPGFDRSIRESFASDVGGAQSGEWVESRGRTIAEGLAAAIVLGSNGPRWRDDVTDLFGLWEAQRFNAAATSIVKNLVGRERPQLEAAQEAHDTSALGLFMQSNAGFHQSFYSFHASSTFTTIAYADLVLSSRLREHPAYRRWARAGLYGLGSVIAWQRIRQDGHYFSDVAVGALAGTFTGRSFYAFNHRDGEDRWLSWDPRGGAMEPAAPSPRRRFSIAPPVPLPGGLFLAARVEF